MIEKITRKRPDRKSNFRLMALALLGMIPVGVIYTYLPWLMSDGEDYFTFGPIYTPVVSYIIAYAILRGLYVHKGWLKFLD